MQRRRQKAISALLNHSTIEAVAIEIGIAPDTMWKWVRLPQSRAEFRAARYETVDFAITRLQYAKGQAIETLERNLTCGQPSVEVRAALGILKQSYRAVVLEE